MLPFSDQRRGARRRSAENSHGGHPRGERCRFWSGLGLVAPLRARVSAVPCRRASPAFRSTRARSSRAICSSRSRATTATATITSPRLSNAARRRRWSTRRMPSSLKRSGHALCRARHAGGARRARPRRARARARRGSSRVTGSVGKTSTKEALREVLSHAGADACLGRVLQQSLGRAADAGAHAARRALRRLRDRHEPCRRDPAAGRAWCGRMSRSSPPSRRCISNISPPSRRSPTPRRRSFRRLVKGGVAILNRDDRRLTSACSRRPARGRAGACPELRRNTRTPTRVSSIRDRKTTLARRHRARARAQICSFRLGAPGRAFAINALAVLLAARAVGRRSRRGRGDASTASRRRRAAARARRSPIAEAAPFT